MAVLILSHPSMYPLAKDMMSFCKGVNPSIVFEEMIEWDTFNDGFPRLFIKDVSQLKKCDVVFLASFHSPASIFEQISILHNIPRYFARSLSVVLPYFPCSTMERITQEGEIATAKSVARLLSGIPLSRGGPCEIIVFDIHALQERFYFEDSVIPRMETAVPLLYPDIEKMAAQAPVTIAFPDDGASKRFSQTVTPIVGSTVRELIICAKIRKADGGRIVKVRDGDPSGSHVVIIDDLVMTGGTMIECANSLKAMGATKVSAYVTHGVFPNASWKRFTENDTFHSFWITDSLPQAREICQHPPFKLLSLASKIIEVLTEDVPH